MNTRQQTERVAKKGLKDVDGSRKSDAPGKTRPAGGTILRILQVCVICIRMKCFLLVEEERLSVDPRQVIRTEGWGGLYSGLKPSLLGTAASQV